VTSDREAGEVGHRAAAREIAGRARWKAERLAHPLENLDIDPGTGVVMDDVRRVQCGVEE
jgi:hypothetical protein